MRRRRTLCLLGAAAVAGGVGSADAQVSSTEVASVAAFPPGRAATSETEAVPVVIELLIGDLASVTVPGFRVGDEALVPLSALLRLAEIRHVLHANGTLEATVQPGNVSLIVSEAHDVMSYGSRRATIPRALRIFRGGELYVGARALAELLGVELVVDWHELTVAILNPGSLPVARRVAREAARRRLLGRDDGPAGPALAHALQRPPLDGLVLDYTVSARGVDPLRTATYSLGAGMNAFGGSLEGFVVGAGVSPAQSVRYTGGWTGVWAGNAFVRQLRLGDGVSTGLSPRSLRGGTATNSPFMRPTRFGIDGFRGALATGAGWEVEAYRGGQLLGFDTTDAIGRYTIPIPTEYGENALEFVAYGPYGEIRHFDRMYRVAGELVPARQLEYGLSGGACVDPRCAATANVDLRYGLTGRWTARAGYDGFRRDSLAMLSHPYVGVVGSLTDAIGVQLDAIHGASARGLLRYEPSTRLRLATEYTHYDLADSVPILTPAGWRSRWIVSALVRPKGPTSATYVEGDAAHVETVDGTRLRARLITSGQLWDARLSPYVRFERDARRVGAGLSRSFVGLNTSILPRTRWRGLGHGWVRTSVEFERAGGFSEASLSVSRQFSRGVRVEGGGKWTPASATAVLLTAIDLATVRSYTTMLVPSVGSPATTQYLQGSIVVNTAAPGIALAAGPSLQRSGVAGRVFLDGNSNGLPDVGEPMLPNVTVRVGALAGTSDSRGRFEIWNVTPYEPAQIAVDTASLSSPLWIPRFGTLTVVPGPNRFVVIDVPIVPAGAIEGRVVLEDADGRRPVGNARLALIDNQTGTRQAITTFGDGEFVAIGVRPGRYEVALDAALLEQLQASLVPTRFTLPPSADGATVKGILVVLRKRDPQR